MYRQPCVLGKAPTFSAISVAAAGRPVTPVTRGGTGSLMSTSSRYCPREPDPLFDSTRA
jgi:hypothetical protein